MMPMISQTATIIAPTRMTHGVPASTLELTGRPPCPESTGFGPVLAREATEPARAIARHVVERAIASSRAAAAEAGKPAGTNDHRDRRAHLRDAGGYPSRVRRVKGQRGDLARPAVQVGHRVVLGEQRVEHLGRVVHVAIE